LGWLLEGLRTIAVAGTHGKTTTSSMLAVILDRAGWDPTFVIGGEVLDLDASACFGTGAWAVVEADEYDRSFLQLRPDIAVITNVEPDHLEYYGSVEAMREAYQQFVARIVPGGTLVVNAGDPYLRSLEAPAGINLVGCSLTDPSAEAGGAAGPSVSAGSGGGQTQRSVPTAIDAYDDPIESESATWRATAGHEDGEGSAFRISGPEGVTLVRLPVSGRHNMLNAVEAIAAVAAAGIEPAVAASALSAFRGARRRFQLVGEAANVLVIDDYAHHPTEIRATLAAARARFSGRRIVVVFQPHTYSRTKLLFDDFVSAFDDADLVVLTDIYGARETDTLGMSTGLLAGALTSRLDSRRVLQTGDLAGVAGLLAPKLCAADVVLTLGAGTVTEVGPRLIEMLHGRGAGGPQDE
jgi:UDP-N-acetylmuramate--alanine ligase